MSTTWRFFLAMFVAPGVGVVLGALMEATMIRPLYERPMYQLMLTLGLSFIIIEVVRAIWGRPEFTMPKAAFFDGSGDLSRRRHIGDLLAQSMFDDYPVRRPSAHLQRGVHHPRRPGGAGGMWLIFQRTRIGMIIRAGVQDSEMVEALGINVRQVFTLVFAMGVGLATWRGAGGALHWPVDEMGTRSCCWR